MDALELVVAGLPVAVLVALGVQGLKVFGVVSDSASAGRSALIIALSVGVLVAVGQLVPDAAPFIELGLATFAGAMVAGLGYQYIAKPILESFGIDVSSESLDSE